MTDEPTPTEPKPEPVKPTEPEAKPAEATPEPPSKSEDMISKANTAAARIEEANMTMQANIAKLEEINVKAALGGRTEAGGREKTAEEKQIEDAEKYLVGTGFEGLLKPKV